MKVSWKDIVFVHNATIGINSVLRSLWSIIRDRRSKDQNMMDCCRRFKILHLSTVYGAVGYTIQHVADMFNLEIVNVPVSYPCSTRRILASVETELQKGDVLLSLFDHISSSPGVIVPVQPLSKLCQAHGSLVFIDGAHAIGQVPLDLTTLGADFFVTNCHKWLHSPRGCAVSVFFSRSGYIYIYI